MTRQRILGSELPRHWRLYREAGKDGGLPDYTLYANYPSPYCTRLQLNLFGMAGLIVGPFVLLELYSYVRPYAAGAFSSAETIAWPLMAAFSWGRIDTPSGAMSALLAVLGVIFGWAICRRVRVWFLDETLEFSCGPTSISWEMWQEEMSWVSRRQSGGFVTRSPAFKPVLEIVPDAVQRKRIERYLARRRRDDVADDALAVVIAFGPHGVGRRAVARIEATNADTIALRLASIVSRLLEITDPDTGSPLDDASLLLIISSAHTLNREAAQ